MTATDQTAVAACPACGEVVETLPYLVDAAARRWHWGCAGRALAALVPSTPGEPEAVARRLVEPLFHILPGSEVDEIERAVATELRVARMAERARVLALLDGHRAGVERLLCRVLRIEGEGEAALALETEIRRLGELRQGIEGES